MLLTFAQFIQSTAFFTELRGSGYMYPVILSLHMVAIALFGGMILMTDMRLLGWAMSSYPVADVVDRFRVPKRVGFVLIATCGILMACCKAEEYYYNGWFRLKLALLAMVALHALIFRRGVYHRAEELDRAAQLPAGTKPAAGARIAGAISLLLWIGIACAGRGIGYIEPPLEKIHARLLAVPRPQFTMLAAPAPAVSLATAVPDTIASRRTPCVSSRDGAARREDLPECF